MTKHLRGSAPGLENLRRCNFFPCKKIKTMRTAKCLVIFFPLKLKLLHFFGSQKLSQNILPMSEVYRTTHLNHSFLLTLALKTMTCFMALLIPASSISYRLSMGYWLRIGTYTIRILDSKSGDNHNIGGFKEGF